MNPATLLTQIEEILPDIDLLPIMSVNPGFGGQQFIQTTLPKIIKARKMLNALPNKPLLEVDGGVNLQNIAGIARAGADILVAGASVFGTDNYSQTIPALKAAANSN